MIEMLGVLAIVGVLSVGGIAGYSKAMTKFKTNKVADQVSMVVTNIRTLYAQQTNYTGLTNLTAQQMGVIPEEYGSSGVGKNPFAGDMKIGSGAPGDNATGGATGAFWVGVTNLPKEACVTLATNDWGSSYSSGFIGMVISGSNGAPADNANLKTGNEAQCTKDASSATTVANPTVHCGIYGPLNVAKAAQACSSQTSNSITWKFY